MVKICYISIEGRARKGPHYKKGTRSGILLLDLVFLSLLRCLTLAITTFRFKRIIEMKELVPALVLCIAIICSACSKNTFNDTNNEGHNLPGIEKETGFARGADVSWLTKMEWEGRKFFTPGNNRQDNDESTYRRYFLLGAPSTKRLQQWIFYGMF